MMGIAIRGRRVTVCNCCGSSFREMDEELCLTCHEPMCSDCYLAYRGVCCVELPPSMPLVRVRLIQLCAKSRRLAADAAKGE